MSVVVRKRHIRNAALAVLISYVLLGVGLFLSLNAIQTNQRNELVRAQVASCERGNVLRSNQNANSLVVKSVLVEVSGYMEQTAENYRNQGSFQLASRGKRVADNLRDLASRIEGQPLRDCNTEYGELN